MERRFRLLYDFNAESGEELACKQGEIVTAISAAPENGWMRVKISRQGAAGVNIVKQGLVPFSYLAEVAAAAGAPSGTHRSAPPPPGVAVPRPPIAQPVPHVVPSAPPAPVNIAVEHAECAICYDEMVSRPCAILLTPESKRSCRHFLHKDCAEGLLRANQKTCPICRAPFVAVAEVPSFDANPKRWFDCVDANGDGTLSKGEVMEVLKATMAIDYRALDKNVDTLWPRWDKDRSGEIDFTELCDQKIGLLVYVRSHFARKRRDPPPALNVRNLEVWFQYWDEDDNGSLEKDEILRALVKTFQIGTQPAKLAEMRQSLDVLWPIFDSDGSGEIELGEFIARDGLGESLCASLAIGR